MKRSLLIIDDGRFQREGVTVEGRRTAACVRLVERANVEAAPLRHEDLLDAIGSGIWRTAQQALAPGSSCDNPCALYRDAELRRRGWIDLAGGRPV